MGWSKRQLVEAAFGELALAGYVFDLQPEELQAALNSMDAMMATFDGQGIHIGYALAPTPDDTDLDQDSGIPLACVEAIYTALALRIAGRKGKAIPASLRKVAKDTWDALLLRCAKAEVQEIQLPNTAPLGQGTKPWRAWNRPYSPKPDTGPLVADGSGNLQLLGD